MINFLIPSIFYIWIFRDLPQLHLSLDPYIFYYLLMTLSYFNGYMSCTKKVKLLNCFNILKLLLKGSSMLYMLVRAGLPIDYWQYAFKCAVHLINKLPIRVLLHKSPFKLLFNQKLAFDQLIVFGCLCYPYIRPYNSNKIEPIYILCVFLRYPPSCKGYWCIEVVKR